MTKRTKNNMRKMKMGTKKRNKTKNKNKNNKKAFNKMKSLTLKSLEIK